MKNIDTILSEIGVEIPKDKSEAFKKAFNENYKTIAEYDKIKEKADTYEKQVEETSKQLEKFKDVKPDELQKEIEDWKQKAKDAEADFNKRIAERDLNDALNVELEKYKFSSNSAKKAIIDRIKAEELKVKDGKVLGLSDLIDIIKKEDESAFVSEAEEKKAKFTEKKSKSNDGTDKVMTRSDIANIKDRDERRKAIMEHQELFEKGE